MGSHGSGIETLDLPNSRQRRMIRPPTASGNTKPPNLPPASNNLNQIQELHQNNRLTRPDTGSKRLPSGGPTDDGDILNLLDESQNAQSNQGSIGGAKAVSVKKETQFQATTSNVDFERDEEQSEYEYDEESAGSDERADPDDSDEDGGSYY